MLALLVASTPPPIPQINAEISVPMMYHMMCQHFSGQLACYLNRTNTLLPTHNFRLHLKCTIFYSTLIYYCKLNRIAMEIYKVVFGKKARRDLLKVPKHIIQKLTYWVDEVGNEGLSAVRKIPGFHDEPLKGDRVGQRSIRLNKAYRAIYEVDQSGIIHFVEIVEVNKHEY